jgi:hypothetical protein
MIFCCPSQVTNVASRAHVQSSDYRAARLDAKGGEQPVQAAQPSGIRLPVHGRLGCEADVYHAQCGGASLNPLGQVGQVESELSVPSRQCDDHRQQHASGELDQRSDKRVNPGSRLMTVR